MKRVLFLGAIIAGFGVFGWWLYFLASRGSVDVLQPSGIIADQQRDLIYFTIVLSALIVVPVFILLAIFALRYRATNPKAAYDPEWAESRKLEVAWWSIPIGLISVLAVVTWFSSVQLDPYKSIASDNQPIKVEVVALQWKWLFIYPQHSVAAVNLLPVPVNTPIEFDISADAPMSAFWVPALGSQIYAMNGMTSQLNLMASKVGTYKGYSTNINGEGYADMVFDVKAMQRPDFDQWIAETSNSNQALDFVTYEELAHPSVIDVPRQYALAETGLYDKITAKYMEHGHGEARPGQPRADHRTTEHSGGHHE